MNFNSLNSNQNNNNKPTRGISSLIGVMVLFLCVIGSGCRESCDKQMVDFYEPIYRPLSEIRVEAQYETPRVIENPGKIYYKDQYIFINEIDAGIHVIDNRNLSNPVAIAFINIPGNKDLAAKGDFMYADSYMDLVVLDISDKNNIRQSRRVEDVFDSYYYYNEGDQTVLVDHEVETREVEVDCDEGGFIDWWGRGDSDVAFAEASGGDTGTGGSLARFTITGDHLYTINEYSMKLFDISNLESPVEGNRIDLGWGIETIFPYDNKLFIGAMNGMHIYDNSIPESPEYVSSYTHATACDPVVVQGDYAYVTLRSGRECDTFTNQLDVIDISDVSNPVLVKSYPMENPHGLGINGTCLFVTEGEHGLKVFDATDVHNIDQNMIAYHRNVHAIDVIPLNNTLFMIGNDGLHQYNYNCEDQFDYLSTIPF